MKSNSTLSMSKNFIRIIKTKSLRTEILPNSSPDYTLFQETLEVKYYINDFLRSSLKKYEQDCRAGAYCGEE